MSVTNAAAAAGSFVSATAFRACKDGRPEHTTMVVEIDAAVVGHLAGLEVERERKAAVVGVDPEPGQGRSRQAAAGNRLRIDAHGNELFALWVGPVERAAS